MSNDIKNNDIKWSFYAEMQGTDKPVLLSPLEWKGGNQMDNLIKILEFYRKFNIPDKTKILTYKSYPGTGKSAIILHAVKYMGRSIIVTPFKNLQRQYYEDYYKGNKFVLKDDGTRLKVAVMLGRNNFKCRWLEEQYALQQKIIEENKKLEETGAFIPVDDNILAMYRQDSTCANRNCPCTRGLKIISTGRNRKESRWMAGSECPYWIPTPISKSTIDKWKDKTVEGKSVDEVSEDDEGVNVSEIKKNIPETNKKAAKTQLELIQDTIKCHNIAYYESTGWGWTGVFIRDEVDDKGEKCPAVCPYYQQFYNYAFADVIVMNGAKWKLETMIGRKPLVKLETFDEGDFWLDSHSVEMEFSRSMIDKLIPVSNKMQKLKTDTLLLFDIAFDNIKKKVTEQINVDGTNIIASKDYRELFLSMTNTLLEYKKSVEEDDFILNKILEMATILRYLDKASISYKEEKRESNKIKLYIPYPDMLLKDLFERSSENIMITSGTIHSNFVLSNLFGIDEKNYIVGFVQGRKETPGKLICIKPKDGLVRVTHTAWQSPQFKEYYSKMLNYILDNLKIQIDKRTGRPGEAKILVLTPAKKYADGIKNRPDIFLDFAKTKENDDGDMKKTIITSLSEFVDKSVEDIKKIKPDDIQLDGDVLRTNQQIIVSTRMIRGADLKDDKCRAVVMTKWPMSDVSAGYNQALKKRFGENIYWAIMKDRAEREAIQYVCRGLRHQYDWEYFSTPDDFAFNQIYRLFTYE